MNIGAVDKVPLSASSKQCRRFKLSSEVSWSNGIGKTMLWKSVEFSYVRNMQPSLGAKQSGRKMNDRPRCLISAKCNAVPPCQGM